MKKIVSLILACVMAIGLSITAFSASMEKNFSMITNTGIINLEGTAGMDTNLVPDTLVSDSIVICKTDAIPNITSVKLEAEGIKYGSTITKCTYDFINYDNAACTNLSAANNYGDYWKLNVYTDSAPTYQFLPSAFTKIFTMRIIATGYFETDNSTIYYDWGTQSFKTDDVAAFAITKDFDTNTQVNTFIKTLVNSVRSFNYATKQVKNDYAFIENTDANLDNIIVRNEVVRLSYSQLGAGFGIRGFEGLASQVTEFFNKKLNGTITFVLTDDTATYSDSWLIGGIPSTEIGMRGIVQNTNDIVGLFVNYEHTGSLMSAGIIEEDTITFDISDILDDINGNTSIISSIYYGLSGGNIYSDLGKKGFKVKEVILSTEDDEKVIAVEDVEEIEIPIVDDEDDIVIEDDNDTTIEEEDDIILDDDTETEEIEIVIDEDDDVNPHTGVTLAVIPTLIAGIIMVTTKKRK